MRNDNAEYIFSIKKTGSVILTILNNFAIGWSLLIVDFLCHVRPVQRYKRILTMVPVLYKYLPRHDDVLWYVRNSAYPCLIV